MSRLDLSKNRTTVRSIFSGLQAVSPAMAAQLAAISMFRTSRGRADAFEASISARAEHLRLEAWSGFCQALLTSNEFLFLN